MFLWCFNEARCTQSKWCFGQPTERGHNHCASQQPQSPLRKLNQAKQQVEPSQSRGRAWRQRSACNIDEEEALKDVNKSNIRYQHKFPVYLKLMSIHKGLLGATSIMCRHTDNPLPAGACTEGEGMRHALWWRGPNSKVDHGENSILICLCHVLYIVHVHECVCILILKYPDKPFPQSASYECWNQWEHTILCCIWNNLFYILALCVFLFVCSLLARSGRYSVRKRWCHVQATIRIEI